MRRLGIILGCAGIALAALAPGAGAATITVDTFDDSPAAVDFDCSLRKAVESANTNTNVADCTGEGGYSSAPDTILLEGGETYDLTLDNSPPENDNVRGDIDIDGPVTITTTGAGLATVDQGDTVFSAGTPDFEARDRVFHVEAAAGAVTFNRLKITGGLIGNGGPAPGIPFLGGGGILTEAPLTITGSEIVDNISREYNVNFSTMGGGIMVRGALARLTMSGSTVAGNTVQTGDDFGSGSAIGGGIAAFAVTNNQPAPLGVDITNSTISGNKSEGTVTGHVGVVGGIFATNGPFPGNNSTTVNLTNVTVTGNVATAVGTPANGAVGGVQLKLGTTTGSIIAGNTDTATASSFDDCGISNNSGGGNLIGRISGAPENACAYSGPNDLVGGTTAGTSINPNLGNLLLNGGLTRTHAPNLTSPAIDRGGTCPATDQTGLFRFSGLPCDAGSVEIGASTMPPPTPTQAQAPVVTPGLSGQRAAALKKCKKKKSAKARKKCKKKAKKLPV